MPRLIPHGSPDYIVFVLEVLLIATVPMRLLIRKWNLNFSDNLTTFVLAFLTGVTISIHLPFKRFSHMFMVPPQKLLSIYMPTFIMASMVRMDYYVFNCCLPQVLILSIVGACLCPLLFAIVLLYLVYDDWTYMDGIFVAMVVTPIQPLFMIRMFKDLTKNRFLATFLEEESLIVCILSVGTFTLILYFDDYRVTLWHQFLTECLLNICKAVFFGLFVGVVKVCSMRLINNDPIYAICITTGLTYFTYYFAEYVIWSSGSISVFVVSYLFVKERHRWSAEVELSVCTFWRTLYYWMDIFVLYICVTWLTFIATETFELSALYGSVSLYLIGGAIRTLKNFLLLPILNSMTYKLNMSSVFVLSFADVKGSINLILLLLMLNDKAVATVVGQCITHVLAFVLLTNAANCIFIGRVLNWAGFLRITQGRLRHIHTCFKAIHEKRLVTIQSLRLNRYLSPCMWTVIIKDTILLNPYASKMELNKKEIEDWYEKKIGCPECDEDPQLNLSEEDLVNLLT